MAGKSSGWSGDELAFDIRGVSDLKVG